jgi:alpha-glucosidase
MALQNEWWQSAVFYQIYPRSFADGNGDGMGDFAGMIDKLDYLQDLGVDAVWLSPHFPSPFVDCGYDVADYEGVAPEYGDLQDFKRFLDGLHARGMHLVLDLVLNHTSDQHPWFIESRSSLDNPKRDWYVWKKGKNGQAPTNWNSTFGGSGWELDPTTDEYYYHFFFKEQPDLNWKNPAVKRAMFDSVRFWLDLGVDGFRLDAVGTIFEDENYFDHPENLTHEELVQLDLMARTSEEQINVSKTWERMFQYQHDMPGVHELMKELRQVMDEYDHRVLVGETDEIAFYGKNDDELHLVFNFPLMRVNQLTAAHVRENQAERLAKLPAGAWPCNTLGNHDTARMFSHFGDGKHNLAQARLNLTMLLTLKGTPFLYNGEEIGMSDYLLSDLKQFRDPLSPEYVRVIRKLKGLGEKEAVLIAAEKGRDKCRTPLQWARTANGGFCPEGVTPWLPLNPDYLKGVNVADEMRAPNSLWCFYQKLLHLRAGSNALKLGEFEVLIGLPVDVLGFMRTYNEEQIVVLLNFSGATQKFNSTLLPSKPASVLFEGDLHQWSVDGSEVILLPYSCVLLA